MQAQPQQAGQYGNYQHQQQLGSYGQQQQTQQQQTQAQPQPQQQQQQQQQAAGQDANGRPPAPASNGSTTSGPVNPPMNLANVLHYLQSEWRRWERDRNEWEIERAELRARIALLEGERRSAENLKTDLLRRVKMLEFALRQERGKTLSSSSTSAAAGQATNSKLTSLAAQEKAGSSEQHKEGSVGTDSPKSSVGQLPNGRSGPSKDLASASSPANMAAWRAALTTRTRDGNSQARSRDYLKQCLQEISYLTSPAALNPLPNKPAFDIPAPSASATAQSKESTQDGNASSALEIPPRPKKVLEDPVPSSSDASKQDANKQQPSTQETQSSTNASSADPALSVDTSVSDTNQTSSQQGEKAEEEPVLTAIYRPESREVWKKALQDANQKAEKAEESAKTQVESGQLSEFPLAVESDPIQSSLSEVAEVAASSKRHWKQTRQLKSHLDAVHALKFSALSDALVSGSADCTVKVWRLDFGGLADGRSTGNPDIEPQITFRGHSGPVTSVAVSKKGLVFSGSLDATIRVWRIPSGLHKTYSPYDPSLTLDTLVGHTDSVLDVALLPSRDDQEGYLVTAGADGTVKVWDAIKASKETGKGYPLLRSWGYHGSNPEDKPGDSTQDQAQKDDAESPLPVSISPYYPDLQHVLVGYTNGTIKLFALGSGKQIKVFAEEQDRTGELFLPHFLPVPTV